MKKNKTIKIGKLYYIANELRKNITDETEIENTDMTNEFYEELENMIAEGEIIIININAKMRLGKSTCAMSLGKHIFGLLKKYGHQPKNAEFGIKNIARDHQEHTKMMKDPNTMYTIIVTDEENELENTGENVTTERALSKVFSDVQAGRYVHRICCSPKDTTDPNADILLSIVGIDKHEKITHARLYYKFYEGGNEYTQLLGYIRISVKDIIKKWNKVKKHFLKSNPTKEDRETIINASKEDWYTEYMVKKYEKMELITKEGIFRPRMLEYAKVIREVIEELKPLTEINTLLNSNIIRNFVKLQMRNNKIPTSIIGEDLAVREVAGILDLYKTLHKMNREIKKRENKKEQTKESLNELELTREIRKKIAKTITIQEEELKKYQEIYKKYNEKE